MKLYELTYLISPDLSIEELKSYSLKINDFIAQEGGTIENISEPFRKRLGYPIKNKRESFSASLIFRILPEKLDGFKKILDSENHILRYIITARKEKREGPKRIYRRPTGEKPFFSSSPVENTRKFSPNKNGITNTKKELIKTKKVELKEIDKKIDEILNE